MVECAAIRDKSDRAARGKAQNHGEAELGRLVANISAFAPSTVNGLRTATAFGQFGVSSMG
jgi:hypothetical protein